MLATGYNTVMCKKPKLFACPAGDAYRMSMKYVGVDGCRGGWFAVGIGESRVEYGLFDSFSAIFDNYKQIQRCFVDMPIGLPESGGREADSAARAALPGHLKSSIFSVPVRSAVYAETKVDAKSVNEKLTGKSLSEQSLAIIPKIREVDVFLQHRPDIRSRVFESHPELCFNRISGSETGYRKKDLLGGIERLRIIRHFVSDVEDVLVSISNEHPRTKVGSDDILDAFVLALTAMECKGKPNFFPEGRNEPPKDQTGLPMAIWFHAATKGT